MFYLFYWTLLKSWLSLGGVGDVCPEHDVPGDVCPEHGVPDDVCPEHGVPFHFMPDQKILC